MSIKVYLHYEEAGHPEKTSKLAIPKSWGDKKVQDVIGLFTKAYNDKNPADTIDINNVHLVSDGGIKIYSDSVVSLTLGDHCEYHIKHGVHNQHTSAPSIDSDSNSGKLRCKNFGCNKYYNEDDNDDVACKYHSAPPIFHDTMKCWSCCKDRKAYDFEAFQAIEGCTIGRHNSEQQTTLIAASPNAPTTTATGGDDGSSTAPKLRSIADYNNENPTAASAVTEAVKTVFTRKSTRSADGITAKCQRKGCQKTYNIADNTSSACIHHSGQPIFHDAVKFWSCCPHKKCYDFDEFIAVAGCAVGYHDDGVIDI